MTIEQYNIKRTNIIISVQDDLEMLVTWSNKEFIPLDKLSQSDRLIVTLCGFNSVHDMLEDIRVSINRKKKSIQRIETKIEKLNERI